MATFFGEVLPVSSRAVDDDEEEDEDIIDTSESVDIKWATDVSSIIQNGDKYDCKSLIIGVGPAASAFLQAHILHQRHRELGRSTNRNESKVFHLLCVDSEPHIVICYTYTPPHRNRVNEITKQLFGVLNVSGAGGSEVLLLCTAPLSSYLCEAEDDNDRGHVKCVRTSQHRALYPVAPSAGDLPQPNTITGLPAAVLSHCEIHNICGVIYAVYTPTTSYVDYDTITYFKDLTPYSALKYIYKHNSKASEILDMIQKRLQRDSQFV